jgi:hypothetical protein
MILMADDPANGRKRRQNGDSGDLHKKTAFAPQAVAANQLSFDRLALAMAL